MYYNNDGASKEKNSKKDHNDLMENTNFDSMEALEMKKIQDIICFSHLRWDFVFQRPQHLLSRWAKKFRVFYFEEPIYGDFNNNTLRFTTTEENVMVATPHVKKGYSQDEIITVLEELVQQLIHWNKIENFLLWYITPMAMPYTHKLNPKIVVYDCMDELSCFKGAPTDMGKNENWLLQFADIVFTGGYNLYEYKKEKHNNIHPFPSSIDRHHFESGLDKADPSDQAMIAHPRVGFYGVIDERFNVELLEGLARKMANVQFVLIGPVVKIDPAILPTLKNIHYLGQKTYQELPLYLAHWDVAFLPFAKNESTRFISPTKTPEYLCAGKPVVSTSIRDVAVPYGEMGLVHIADEIDDFVKAIKKAIHQKDDKNWQKKVKEYLKTNSWDITWSKMKQIVFETLDKKEMIQAELAHAFSSKPNARVNGSHH